MGATGQSGSEKVMTFSSCGHLNCSLSLAARATFENDTDTVKTQEENMIRSNFIDLKLKN
jgi:hypothetical protein